MTVDTENAFYSINHSFLMRVLEKLEFASEFIKQIKILLKSQETCIVDDRKATPYFKVETGTTQRDPISAYPFIFALEVIFALINANINVQGLQFFSHNSSYSAMTLLSF